MKMTQTIEIDSTFVEYSRDNHMFHWKVQLSWDGRKRAVVSYSQGCAHCKKLPAHTSPKVIDVEIDTNIARVFKPFGTLTISDLEGSVRPTPPTRTSVLHSLQSDAQAGDMLFEDFCSEFGYDNDSIKAHKIWLACVESRLHTRKWLGEVKFNQFMNENFDE